MYSWFCGSWRRQVYLPFVASTHNIFFTIMRSALKQLMPFLSNKNRPLQKNTLLLSFDTKFLLPYRGLNFFRKNYLKFLLVLRQIAKPQIPMQFDAPMQKKKSSKELKWRKLKKSFMINVLHLYPHHSPTLLRHRAATNCICLSPIQI